MFMVNEVSTHTNWNQAMCNIYKACQCHCVGTDRKRFNMLCIHIELETFMVSSIMLSSSVSASECNLRLTSSSLPTIMSETTASFQQQWRMETLFLCGNDAVVSHHKCDFLWNYNNAPHHLVCKA